MTDDEVRELFVSGAWERARNGCDDEENGKEFDAWLLNVKAAVWDECSTFHNYALPNEHVANPYARKRKNLKAKEKREKNKNRPKCPADCYCLCHDGLGDVEHPGKPCFGKG